MLRLADRLAQAFHAAGDIAPERGETGGQESVLADRHQLPVQIGAAEVGGQLRVAALRSGAGFRFAGRAATAQHPVAVDQEGFRAVHGGQSRGQFGRSVGFFQQGELGVQEHACSPAGDGRPGGIRSDAAGRPDGQLDVGGSDQLLQQHERTQRTDQPAAVAAPGDQAVRAQALRVQRVLEAAYFHQDQGAARDLSGFPAGQHFWILRQQQVARRAQVLREDVLRTHPAAGVHPDPERFRGPAAH